MKPLVSLRRAFEDPLLLGGVMGGESRAPMRSILMASQGEELTDSELAHFRRLTGRETPPAGRVEEAHVIGGRRSGKSSGIAALAVYQAALCDHSDCLSPGERGVLLILAENRAQARVILRYIDGAFQQSPALSKLIDGRTQWSLTLANGVEIEVRAADFRGVRGLTLIAALCDEIAFWHSDDSSNPAEEIIAAVKPGLITTRGQLITIGSPYAKRGFQYTTFRQHFGEQGDPRILVAKGGTTAYNPTIDEEFIARQIERDPAAARSEWLGEFRNDIETFVSREAVEACIAVDVFERGPLWQYNYTAFVDPSGGSVDEMTLAIAHREGDVGVLDALRVVKPPFSPSDVVADFCNLLRSYRISRVRGDRYAGEWPREQFRKHGVEYLPSEKPKSDIFRDFLPLINGRRVELLDDKKLVAQLCGLERRTARSGRDSIDHAPGSHDDAANCVAGVLVSTIGQAGATMKVTPLRI
ncbi:hypothetical protein WOC76_12635 [Methylocystis sp. IM3]|uniref:hypothetical protein n=1 Tax=unclassified Methylocystis TaxID=2625913 RepID=UPI0030F9BF93